MRSGSKEGGKRLTVARALKMARERPCRMRRVSSAARAFGVCVGTRYD